MTQETLQHLNTQTLIGYTSKRGKAWHYRAEEQGEESNHYEGPIPVDDVLRRLFNWEAVEGTITATHLDETGVLRVTDNERKAIMRGDTGAILGIFKNGYRIHQYPEWLLENVTRLLDADLQIGSAGLLKGGAVGWVQIELEETMEACGVEFRPFLTAATSLDGSLATTYAEGAQVVVCDNTLSAALRTHETQVKVKHSSRSLGRLSDVRDALGIVHSVAEDFMAEVEALNATSVTNAQWDEFVRRLVDQKGDSKRSVTLAENKTRDLNQLYHHDDRVAPWEGTAWGVISAVNTYTHHVQTVRNASRVERNMERAVTGGIDKLDSATHSLLMSVLV